MYPDGLERLLQQLGQHTDSAHDPVRLADIKVFSQVLCDSHQLAQHIVILPLQARQHAMSSLMLCSVYCRLQSEERFGVSASHST